MGKRQTSKNVLIRISYKTENPEAIKGHTAALKKLQKQEKDGTIITEKQTKKGLQRDTVQKSINRTGVAQYRVQRDLIKQGPQFRMEYLGIMFGGMALQRAMMSLNATSREWLGIGDLMSTMMGVTMLSANEDLLNYGVLPLFDALTSLPEGVQKAIGVTAVALEGLGSTMMAGGQLMLGITSTKDVIADILKVDKSMVFTSKGLAAIKTKMDPIMKNVKYLAAGILLTIAVDDASEGKVIASLGDIGMAVGALGIGGKAAQPWLIAGGFTLKFLGDEEFQEKIYSVFWTILDKTIWFGEAIAKAFTGRWKEIDWTFFNDLGDSASNALIDLQKEGKLTSNTMNMMGKDFTTTTYVNELGALTGEVNDGKISVDEYLTATRNLKDEFPGMANEIKNVTDAFRGYNAELSKYSSNKSGSISTEISNLESSSNFNGNYKLKKSVVGNYAVGTSRVPKTGLAMLHEGETVLRKDQAQSAQGQNITITYNLTATNMREVESMLRESERRTTADIRRLSR